MPLLIFDLCLLFDDLILFNSFLWYSLSFILKSISFTSFSLPKGLFVLKYNLLCFVNSSSLPGYIWEWIELIKGWIFLEFELNDKYCFSIYKLSNLFCILFLIISFCLSSILFLFLVSFICLDNLALSHLFFAFNIGILLMNSLKSIL